MSADIVLLTERRYVEPRPGSAYVSNIFAEDRLLIDALAELGLSAVRRDWASDENWSRYRGAVLRTTWDYFERFAEFDQWLGDVGTKTTLLNSESLVRWNMNKRYLLDLAERGIPTVPTAYLEAGSASDLSTLMHDRNWPAVVIKPAVSGAARNTYRVDLEHAGAYQPKLAELLNHESMLVQPFMPDILARGEITLMTFGSTYTHAIRKTARAGDFRVQDDHGGVVHRYEATAEEVAFARAAFEACPSTPIYGRVDLVRDDDGRARLMELELVEPELWMRFYPPAATVFASNIARHLNASG